MKSGNYIPLQDSLFGSCFHKYSTYKLCEPNNERTPLSPVVVSDGLDVARDPEDVRRVVGGGQGNDDGAVRRAVDVASQRGAGRLSRELWLGRSFGEWQNTWKVLTSSNSLVS